MYAEGSHGGVAVVVLVQEAVGAKTTQTPTHVNTAVWPSSSDQVHGCQQPWQVPRTAVCHIDSAFFAVLTITIYTGRIAREIRDVGFR